MKIKLIELRHTDVDFERRHSPQKIAFREHKADGIIGVLEGYPVVYSSESRDFGGWREVITPGAFDQSLKDSDVRALWQHQDHNVLGRMSAKTLTIRSDSVGVFASISLIDTQFNQEVMKQVRSGNVDGMSFGMPRMSVKDAWEKREGYALRNIKQATLMEVSIVTWPAYDAASISSRAFTQFREQNPDKPTSAPISLLRGRLAFEQVKR